MSGKTSYEKAKFRKTKEWLEFRADFRARNLDRLTEEPLKSSYVLHHSDLNPEHYTELDPNKFMGFNTSYEHKLVHYVYEKFIRDPKFLMKLENVIKEMVEVNKWKSLYDYRNK